MAAILFRNVQVWDGSADDRFPGEVLVAGARIAKVARGDGQIAGGAGGRDDRRVGPHADARPRRRPLPPFLLQPDAQPGPRRDPARRACPAHHAATPRSSSNHGFTSCLFAPPPPSSASTSSSGSEIEDGYLAGPALSAPAGPEITVTGGLGDERKQHMHARELRHDRRRRRRDRAGPCASAAARASTM